MDSLDQDRLAVWKRELAEVQRLLAAQGAADGSRGLRPGEIAYLDGEAIRLAALIAGSE